MDALIKKIEDAASFYFKPTIFKLNKQPFNRYIIGGENPSKALNKYNNDGVSVNVLPWFDNFWAYFEIKFNEQEIEPDLDEDEDEKESYLKLMGNKYILIDEKYYAVILSLSIFYGLRSDPKKAQLFRAEWDNFEHNQNHPQPHWHFSPYEQYPEYENYVVYEELFRETTFVDSLETTKKIDRVFPINKFHFAMNGQWAESQSHIHRINAEEMLILWWRGILQHIKKQLEHCSP